MTHYNLHRSHKDRYTIQKVHGDCLAALGITSEDSYAIVDANATPLVGDIVWCNKIAGGIVGYLKQVKRINPDGTYIVGTAYLDVSKNIEFEVEEILGVVLEVYDARVAGFRSLLYERCIHRMSDGSIYHIYWVKQIDKYLCIPEDGDDSKIILGTTMDEIDAKLGIVHFGV